MMNEHERSSDKGLRPVGVNPLYAAYQWARALVTAQRHEDAATRLRAEKKLDDWQTVLGNILSGSVSYGSRTPFEGVPGWATLEVAAGGFATGRLLAAGPLQEHERRLLQELQGKDSAEDRRALNAHYLTDAGLAQLLAMLRSGRFDIEVPEEGALMVVAWLVENGHVVAAGELIEAISSHLTQLRFYPVPVDEPRSFGTLVHVQDAASTLADLRRIPVNSRIMAFKEAVGVWIPLHDRVVALFLETVEDGWPCQHYPADWQARAKALLDEYAELRKTHSLCGKIDKAKEFSSQLRQFLDRCVCDPKNLTGREVARIRTILNCYVANRGAPGSAQCIESRRRQAAAVSSPTWQAIAKVLLDRLEKFPAHEGIDPEDLPIDPVSREEAAESGVPEGTEIPSPYRRRVERCMNAPVSTLVEHGVISSGEALAKCLPQMTSGIRALGIVDADLRNLYAAIYRAFRRRRSLLLLNLEHQVRIEELPWVAAIEKFRDSDMASRNFARESLAEVVALTLVSFPQAIIPNKLLQELRALVTSAGLKIPLADELATDIFMGEFTAKYVEAAHAAADLLEGSLYATYYGIDYAKVRRIPIRSNPATHTSFWSIPGAAPGDFAQLCTERAGVTRYQWAPASNGMIIEQQQILTTQNLAALFSGLDLIAPLRDRLGEMARRCFVWVCRSQQMQIKDWHGRLRMTKNTAYAWRQMVFFLSLQSDAEVSEFLAWAESHLESQKPEFRERFAPAMRGLTLAVNGIALEDAHAAPGEIRRFLGWSNSKHWLMCDPANE